MAGGEDRMTAVLDLTDEDRSAAPAAVTAPPGALTRQELRLRFWLKVWAASFVIEIALYLWWGWGGASESRAFAVNSVSKDLTFLVLAVLVIADVRRFGRLMTLLVIGHLALALVLASYLVLGVTAMNFPATPAAVLGLGPFAIPSGLRVPAWLLAASFATANLAWLHITARRSRMHLRHLFPTQFETLVAVAETVITDPRVPPAEIATAIDEYWAGFHGRSKSRSRLVLSVLYFWPLLSLPPRAPFPLMDAEGRRRFIERRFLEGRLWFPSIARPAIHFAIQMAYTGYYSRAEVHADTGYVPFSKRVDELPPKPRSTLKTLDPGAPPADLEADVVIVGTGAGGGVLAHELVEQGHDVLMLERGDFVDPATFTEDEMEMYSRLYSDGLIQVSRDFSFRIIQGRCVGGSTVVNNAVCFDLPPEVLAAWNEDGAGLPENLDDSFAAVRTLMRVTAQRDAPMSMGVAKVAAAVKRLGLHEPPYGAGVVDANIAGCLGCGYCNIGCAYDKKLSMLNHVLPAAQRTPADGGSSKGRLRILPACEVTRIDREGLLGAGSHRVGGVRCRVGADRRELRVKAGTVIVAAGAIQSSRLLQRSHIGGARVGLGLCANLASFMIGDFPDQVRSFEGLQMARYVEPPIERGYVLETWFDSVALTALSMPGWLQTHQYNMSRYAHMMCMGVLVGTDARTSNRVHRLPSISGSEYSFRPSDAELMRLARALREAGTILFEAGSDRVMPATFRYREFKRGESLNDLESMLMQRGNALLQTAHPQGGNRMSADRSAGVVDPTCRVHGYENLYVCDASVFPSAARVNPQLTVMALAHHAATHPDGLGGLARTRGA
jgi:choline dehydrogenase-like flavoprotein